jgi:spore coat polysaccharide biosynthesis protein SpsF (cytidylyltransferase family)
MKKLILSMRKDPVFRYVCELSKSTSSKETAIIEEFLTTTVGNNTQTFKDLICSPTFKIGGGMATTVEKEEDYLVMRDRSDKKHDRNPKVYIPKAEMIRLLDWWEEVWKHKPEEIKLIFDGQQFMFDPQYGI